MSADRIEVTEKNNGKLAICVAGVLEDLLDHVLGLTVGVGAVTNVHILGDRHRFGIAVNGCGRAKYKLVTAVLLHGFKKGKGRVEVVSVVKNGKLYGLADSLKAGKVYNCVDLIFLEDGFKGCLVSYVVNVELDLRSGDSLNASYGFGLTVHEVVNDDNTVSLFNKLNCGMGTDKSGSACEKYVHFMSP